MARYDEEQLAEIRDRIDIVQFIGRYVKLKQSGRNFLGLCPFHQEKTPSFSVHRERQFFHCFGCKESGDIFDFVMKYEHLTFPEAVQRLAEEAGIKLPEPRRTAADEAAQAREKEAHVLRANTIAAEYFAEALRSPDGAAAVAYLKRRGIDGRIAKRFRLGYAPNRWDGLLTHLKAHGIPPEVAVEAGLAVQREGREPFDLFRDRVMFPITDVRGRVLGFGGRVIAGDGPKYINTPQTAVFTKRAQLYGLEQAKDAARAAGYLIVCEGYMDVIALAQFGIENAVASLGTAFTEEHAKLLGRWVKEVVLAFDADPAGRSATERGLDMLAAAGLRVRVAVLPEGEDPDSFVRAHGREAFLRRIESALPLTEYKIDEVLRTADLATVEGRAQAVEALLPVLAGVTSPVAREGYIEEVARRVGSTPQAVAAALAQFFRRSGRRTADRHRIERSRYTTIDRVPGSTVTARRVVAPTQRPAARPAARVAVADERTVLWILCHEPEQIDKVYALLGDRPFFLDAHNALFTALYRLSRGYVDYQELSPEIVAALEELKAWEPRVVLPLETYVDRLWEQHMRRKLYHLEGELGRLPERDEKAYAERIGSLLVDYQRLRQAIRRHGTLPG